MPLVRGFLHRWHPKMPGRPDIGLPGEEEDMTPDWGLEWDRPTLPPDFQLPSIPPREEWPPLPPFFTPGVGLPIPPSIEHPWVPVLPDEGVDPPEIWPPLPSLPSMPDFSGKTMVLAVFYVSRHVKFTRWVIIDHAEAKSKLQKALEYLKSKLPAGGIPGRPPGRPQPGG